MEHFWRIFFAIFRVVYGKMQHLPTSPLSCATKEPHNPGWCRSRIFSPEALTEARPLSFSCFTTRGVVLSRDEGNELGMIVEAWVWWLPNSVPHPVLAKYPSRVKYTKLNGGIGTLLQVLYWLSSSWYV